MATPNVDRLFRNYYSNRLYHDSGKVAVDSLNYNKQVDKQPVKKKSSTTTTSQTMGRKKTPPQQKSTSTTNTSRPTSTSSTAQTSTTNKTQQRATTTNTTPATTTDKTEELDVATCSQQIVNGKECGKFHTNLPIYESANITKPQPPYATTQDGVEIYIKGDEKSNPVTLEVLGNGNTKVKFKNSDMYAIIPKQEDPKNSMIVYNPETKTMVFNNLKDISVKTEIAIQGEDNAQKIADRTGGGDNLLFNGCTVKNLNTAEIYKTQKDGDKTTARCVDNYASQNIVLNNTKVSRMDTLNDLYIATGNTTINNANNHREIKDNMPTKKTTTYYASDGKTKMTRSKEDGANGNGQSYFTVAGAIKMLNGGKDAKNIDTNETRGSININNDVMKMKFDNVPVCRTWNGVNFYIKGGDVKSIKNIGLSHNNAGEYFSINGTIVQFPPQADGKDASIYYDAETQSLVFENIDGLEVNYSATQTQESLVRGKDTALGAKTAANVYIRNCHCKHVNFMEMTDINTTTGQDVVLSKDAEKSRSTVMIDETSVVDELLTYKDDVYLHSGAKVKKYAGIHTNVQGQDLTDINGFHNGKDRSENNVQAYVKNQNKLPNILRNKLQYGG